jgi:5-methylcytosine-specific restriction enzyme A
MFNFFRRWFRLDLGSCGMPRSPKWKQVREAFMRAHPRCAATGDTKNLEVHHIRPFHLDPSLELDPSNLITLREDVHLLLGHLCDWHSFNPRVCEDAYYLFQKIENRP